MGKVAITFKIMPDSAERDAFDIKEKINEKVKVQDYHIEEIAFGLKVLRVLIMSEDAATEELEEKIKSIKGVSEVEVESSTIV